MIRYEIRPRPTSWAVVRIGRYGGLRVVAVYSGEDKAVAEAVVRTLNGWADREL